MVTRDTSHRTIDVFLGVVVKRNFPSDTYSGTSMVIAIYPDVVLEMHLVLLPLVTYFLSDK